MSYFKLETPDFLHGGYMLLPEDQSRQYPTIYLIHGTGGCIEWIKAKEGADPNACVKIDKMMEDLVSSGKAEPAIIIMPKMPYYNGSWGNFFDYDILSLVKQVNEKYSHIIKPGRENTAIGGFSLGSTVALKSAINLPDVFGNICIISMSSLMFCCIEAPIISAFKPQKGTELYLGYGLGEDPDLIKKDIFLTELFGAPSKDEYRFILRQIQGGHDFNTFNFLFRDFFSIVFKNI